MGGRIAVATDTNSGIMYGEAERLGVSVVSMPFSIDGQECFEGVDLDVERFYRCQRDGSDIVTSQPSIAALGSADAYYDNQTVQVVGEAIGDSIREGLDNRHRWITLAANEKDSTATVSVLMTVEQAAKIDTFGKYGTTGTKLQVRGTFHLVCTEHEGLTDLHADIVTVVDKGKHHEDEFDVNAFVPGAIATALGLALMGVFYYLRERQR